MRLPEPAEYRLSRLTAALAILVFLSASTQAADSLEDAYAAQGRLILAHLASAPFPHPTRANGYDRNGQHFSAQEHYADDTVAVFIPKGLRPKERVDFVVHFHGWNNTVAGTLAHCRLVDQMVASGKNAVLVVPEGPVNAPDSAGGKLAEPGGFARFMDELLGVLAKQPEFSTVGWPRIGRIILSGHSGGGEVIAEIVDHGGLERNADEVWLFDALYHHPGAFLEWNDHTHGRLLDIYTERGGTKANSEALIAKLVQRGTPVLAVEENKMIAAGVPLGPLTFIHTDLAHDEVMASRDEFKRFLKTSGLEDR